MTSNISTKSQKEILKFVRERTHTIPILALEQFCDHLLPQTLANDRVKLVLESIGIEEIRNYVATIRERVDGGRVSVFDHLQLIFDVVESKGKEVLNIDPCGRISRSADGTNAVGRLNITQLDSASRIDKSKLSRITATLVLKEQSTYGTVMEVSITCIRARCRDYLESLRTIFRPFGICKVSCMAMLAAGLYMLFLLKNRIRGYGSAVERVCL